MMPALARRTHHDAVAVDLGHNDLAVAGDELAGGDTSTR